MMMALIGGGGGVVQNMQAINIVRVEEGGGVVVQVSLIVNSDGSLGLIGEDASGAAQWFQPITPGIGSNFKAMMQRTSGADLGGPPFGTYNIINSQITWTLGRATIGTSQFAGVLNICDMSEAVLSAVAVTMRVTKVGVS